MLLLVFLVHECTSYHKIIRTFHQKKLHSVAFFFDPSNLDIDDAIQKRHRRVSLFRLCVEHAREGERVKRFANG